MRPHLPVPVGERFGRFTVIGPAPLDKHGKSRWVCQCDCGVEKALSATEVKKGYPRSCGCLRHGCAKHGARHPLYAVWTSMRYRCRNPRCHAYNHYGGRGITICERWEESFPNFLEDMGEKPGPEYQLDRIDNDGNYEPENCRWATRSEQAKNRRPRSLNLKPKPEPIGGK